MRVIDLMDSKPPVAVVPGNREDLLRLFARHPLHGLPVVKEGTRKLAGLVLRTDLFRDPAEPQIALLMNPNPITVYAQAPLREAAELAVRGRSPLLPVISGSNDLVGLVTPEGFLEALLGNRSLVQTHLHRRAVPVHRTTPARVALAILQVTGAPALPVLDDDTRLVGIVTDGDLLRHSSIGEAAPEATPAGGPGEGATIGEGITTLRKVSQLTEELQLPLTPVDQIMVRDVRTVQPYTTVGEAAKLLLDHHVSQAPVVNERGRLLDLITDLDLVEALL